MWLENKIFKEDLDNLVNVNYIEWDKFRGKTFFITGATGLIGFNLISGLIYADKRKNLNLKIIAYVRDYNKAMRKYAEHLQYSKCLEFVVGDIVNLPEIHQGIDYIVHVASPTASNFFIENPVETIKISVIGTSNILDLAKEKKVKGVVYLSSMEVYGSFKTQKILTEDDLGYLNPFFVRNCYPESKRLCEALCAAYASEYGVPTMSIRLAQTFGLGVNMNDSRVFAEFARCVVEKRDIVLLTDGSSKRSYLYTMDAVSAILTVLLKGEPGQAYNAANKDTFCSIRDMAELVSKEIAHGEISLIIEKNQSEKRGFLPTHCLFLSTNKIEELGWQPMIKLKEMYGRMIKSWRQE